MKLPVFILTNFIAFFAFSKSYKAIVNFDEPTQIFMTVNEGRDQVRVGQVVYPIIIKSEEARFHQAQLNEGGSWIQVFSDPDFLKFYRENAKEIAPYYRNANLFKCLPEHNVVFIFQKSEDEVFANCATFY